MICRDSWLSWLEMPIVLDLPDTSYFLCVRYGLCYGCAWPVHARGSLVVVRMVSRLQCAEFCDHINICTFVRRDSIFNIQSEAEPKIYIFLQFQ